MKKESDDLKRDIKYLNGENEKLHIQLETSNKRGSQPGASGSAADKEAAKKLRKRELECHALWDTLKDMRSAGQNNYDVR
jgi:regulator of replication initiation timing